MKVLKKNKRTGKKKQSHLDFLSLARTVELNSLTKVYKTRHDFFSYITFQVWEGR